jgi:hypothetical protein
MTRLGQPRHVRRQPCLVRSFQPCPRLLTERCWKSLQTCQHAPHITLGRIQPLAQASRAEAGCAQGHQPRAQFIHVAHALQFTD